MIVIPDISQVISWILIIKLFYPYIIYIYQSTIKFKVLLVKIWGENLFGDPKYPYNILG